MIAEFPSKSERFHGDSLNIGAAPTSPIPPGARPVSMPPSSFSPSALRNSGSTEVGKEITDLELVVSKPVSQTRASPSSFAAAQAALSGISFGNPPPSPSSGDLPSPPSPGPATADDEAKNAKVKNRLSVRMGT